MSRYKLPISLSFKGRLLGPLFVGASRRSDTTLAVDPGLRPVSGRWGRQDRFAMARLVPRPDKEAQPLTG